MNKYYIKCYRILKILVVLNYISHVILRIVKYIKKFDLQRTSKQPQQILNF